MVWYQGKKAVCVENCQNSESEPVKCTKIQSLYKRTLLTFCVRPMFLFLFSPFGDKLSLLFSECVIFLLSRIYNGRVQREVPRFDFLFILWKLSKIQSRVKGKSLRRKKMNAPNSLKSKHRFCPALTGSVWIHWIWKGVKVCMLSEPTYNGAITFRSP